jgi:membrane AbrB-like protein
LNDQPSAAGRTAGRLGQLPLEIWRSGTLQGLLIGAAGGSLFDALGLPAPWISGTMLAVAGAALARLQVDMPGWLRQLAFVVLGFSMGANITPATLARIALWPASLLFLAGSIAATTIVLSAYLRLVHRWDPATAAFSAVPGAFTYLLLMAMRSRADVPRVAVTQLIRLLVLTALLPLLLSALDQGAGTPRAALTSSAEPAELVIALAGCGLVGAVCERLNLPAGTLLGAMFASTLIHGTGLTDARLSQGLLIPAYIVTGTFVGLRFKGVSLRLIVETLVAGLATVTLGLIVAGSFALAAALLLDLPLDQLLLAYAPGGVDVMAIMALALGLDPAFVGVHHALRFMSLSAVLPVWLRRHFD